MIYRSVLAQGNEKNYRSFTVLYFGTKGHDIILQSISYDDFFVTRAECKSNVAGELEEISRYQINDNKKATADWDRGTVIWERKNGNVKLYRIICVKNHDVKDIRTLVNIQNSYDINHLDEDIKGMYLFPYEKTNK